MKAEGSAASPHTHTVAGSARRTAAQSTPCHPFQAFS